LLSKNTLLAFILIVSSACSDSPQQPDPDFIPKNTKNTFSDLVSPIVLIDEAHHNFHTIKGRYKPFAQVLRSDGYTVKPGTKKFSLEYLQQADILVIANALDSDRRDYNPPYGDAFEAEEVLALKQWVTQGGSLFFIADHAPFPVVSDNLSLAFGFEFNNGSVNSATFNKDNNSLARHAITNGISNSEEVVKVESLGGSAFKVPHNAESLLTLGNGASSLMSDIPMKATTGSYRLSMDGWSQGAVIKVGEGRVAIFAEAMMFTSQVYTPTGRKMGLVSYGAEQNEQFLLNVMHWLSGLI